MSLYELVFKANRDRLAPEAMYLSEAASTSGLEELGLTSAHLVHAARLDWNHGDPWDRILLAQATLENMDLISADTVFNAQTERRSW